ncbi:hypothetical protein SDC9_202533 [bioreactor metagenome]|uniref:Uncharacterized protein n=1 Tax=bioreactor metagenome TaxID=1076179 RepID=A0A645ITV5_9ZZZZ
MNFVGKCLREQKIFNREYKNKREIISGIFESGTANTYFTKKLLTG